MNQNSVEGRERFIRRRWENRKFAQLGKSQLLALSQAFLPRQFFDHRKFTQLFPRKEARFNLQARRPHVMAKNESSLHQKSSAPSTPKGRRPKHFLEQKVSSHVSFLRIDKGSKSDAEDTRTYIGEKYTF
jgi:hypothetical protein